MNLKFISLPIYSIAVYGEYIYFSGGGGGSTGIPNQIQIYHRNITPTPANSIKTGGYIIENMTVYEQKQIMVCNANDYIVVYSVKEKGNNLQEKYRFKADFAMSNATINSLCFSLDGSIVVSGGDDMTIRFYKLNQNSSELVHQYCAHAYPIKNVDHNQQDLYLSTDNHQIVIFNLNKKQIVRSIHQDQLKPEKSLFQSAYFVAKGSQQIIMVHFIFKKATYVTKQHKNKVTTVEIAEDQSCQTAFHRDHKLLGIACGNGTTLMFNTNKMKSLGKQQNHKFVITGCTITKKTNRFLTGTPQCSYHIQNPNEQIPFSLSFLLTILITLVLIYLLGNKVQIDQEL